MKSLALNVFKFEIVPFGSEYLYCAVNSNMQFIIKFNLIALNTNDCVNTYHSQAGKRNFLTNSPVSSCELILQFLSVITPTDTNYTDFF